MLNRLDNECLKELFDWRRSPLERTAYLVREDPFCRVQDWFFATLNGKHVGYVGMGIDESYNVKRNTKCGWVLGIGVLKPYRRMGIGNCDPYLLDSTKLASTGACCLLKALIRFVPFFDSDTQLRT